MREWWIPIIDLTTIGYQHNMVSALGWQKLSVLNFGGLENLSFFTASSTLILALNIRRSPWWMACIKVCSEKSEKLDQILDSVLVSCVSEGRSAFVLWADIPNSSLNPKSHAMVLSTTSSTIERSSSYGQQQIHCLWALGEPTLKPDISSSGASWPPTLRFIQVVMGINAYYFFSP